MCRIVGRCEPLGATESTVLGPFWVDGSPLRNYGDPIFDSAAGEPAWVHGRVLDLDGVPIAAAELDVSQNDATQLHSVQDDNAPEAHLRGRFRTRADGSYAFLAGSRSEHGSDRPVVHIHMIVSALGFETLTTHVFDAESPHLDSDAVFAVKPSLLRRFVRDGERWSVESDIVQTPST